jgi:exodeoxyribonuclease III
VSLRVITWNVRTGGSGGRLDAIVALLERERPDLLALQELKDFDRRSGRRMREVAGALGMTATLAPSFTGQPVAVLVRAPLRVTSTSTVRLQLHHAAASVDVGPLVLVSTHLNPFSPRRRLREARWLAHRFRDPRTLLAGDLNSLDPGTAHTERLARLPDSYRRRHLASDGSADTRAMAAFAGAGFTDLWTTTGRGDGLTVPTTRGGGREFSNAGMRLDYLLAGPALAPHATATRVLRGAEAEYASDHYPLSLDLDL